MNRIILIGNGFDLAHGLPTKYEDFINWYLCRWEDKLRTSGLNAEKDGLCSFYTGQRFSRLCDFMSCCPGYDKREPFMSWLKENTNISIQYSELLGRILNGIEVKNWVDIEHEYYKLLLEAIKKSYPKPKVVNEQLGFIQKFLTEYLNSLEIESIKPIEQIRNYIFEPIDENDIAVESKGKYTDFKLNIYKRRLHQPEYEKAYGFYNVDENAPCPALPDNILLLNFNYTSISDLYDKSEVTRSIHIHGTLNDPEHMIFGYGDELDEDYKSLVKPQDNELLRNIKSVKYLEADNYRRMLQFIDSDCYQIYIMGHSCGNSDRTLLNTLFEHKNCVSIKPFYYEHGGKDNYLDIVQNISRNFTDMQLMRDRVVNKTLCCSLPQSKK